MSLLTKEQIIQVSRLRIRNDMVTHTAERLPYNGVSLISPVLAVVIPIVSLRRAMMVIRWAENMSFCVLLHTGW